MSKRAKDGQPNQYVKVDEYNKLVADFNAMAMAHNALVEDAQGLVSFLSSVCTGLRGFTTMKPCSKLTAKRIDAHEVPIMSEDRMFVKDIHNEVVDFLIGISEGKRPSQLYEAWIAHCQEIAQESNISAGGIILQ